jgi:hypothetical protein
VFSGELRPQPGRDNLFVPRLEVDRIDRDLVEVATLVNPLLDVDVGLALGEGDLDRMARGTVPVGCEVWPPDALAAAEAHEIGAEAEKSEEVLPRWQHRRGIHDDGPAAGVGDRDHLLEGKDARRAREGRDQIRDGRRPVADRLLQLEGLCPARQANLDEDPTADPVGLIVGEPMRALDDDFVPHAAAVGQPGDLHRVGAGDARGGLQDEAGARPGGDERRLGAQHPCDGGAG